MLCASSEWRELGMPHRRIGTLIVVNQRVLDRWIEGQWGAEDAPWRMRRHRVLNAGSTTRKPRRP